MLPALSASRRTTRMRWLPRRSLTTAREAWYMLRVRDGATIRVGNRPGVIADKIALPSSMGRSRTSWEVPVAPGDGFLLYAGTMHYSAGACSLLRDHAELRRLHWPACAQSGARRCRRDRRAQGSQGVHIEDGFSAKTTPVVLGSGANQRIFVFACRYFCAGTAQPPWHRRW